MGLRDRAKQLKKEEGAEAPEPVKDDTVAPATEAPQPTEGEVKTESEPTEKKAAPKKTGKKTSGKKSTSKKPIGKKKPAVKKKSAKKPVKKAAPKPKKKKKEEPEEADIQGVPDDIAGWASIQQRLIAQLIDGILLGVVLFVLLIILAMSLETAGIFIWLVAYLALPVVYFMFMEGNNGQTVGKGLMDIRVMSTDGKAVNPQKVMKSSIWKGLFFPFLSIIDVILGIAVKHKDTKQRHSQYESDLIVVALKKKEKVINLSGTAADDDEGEESEGSEETEAGAGSWDSPEVSSSESEPETTI